MTESDGDTGVQPASLSAEDRRALAETDAALSLDLADLERRDDPHAPIEIVLPPAYVQRAFESTDAHADRPGRVSLSVMVQSDGTVLIQGSMAAHVTVACARCLSDAPVEADCDIVATFVPASRIRGLLEQAGVDDAEGLELESEELEEYPYEGQRVDLRRLVDEQLGLAYPMRALCEFGEQCAGLCPSCGTNLNEDPPASGRCAKCGSLVDPTAEDAVRTEDEPDWKAKLRLLKGD